VTTWPAPGPAGPAPTFRASVVGEGLRLTLFGAVIGLVGAALGARLVAGMLYGVSALDPVAPGERRRPLPLDMKPYTY
jgi:hypothetical protein